MGNSIWDLFVSLGIDTKDFEKGVAGAVATSKNAHTELTKNLASVGGTVVAGGIAAVGAATAALGGFLASTIGPASDLNETMSKSGVVFGTYAASVAEWGQKSAQAFGMSTNEAVGAAATYGNLFKSMGMGETQVSDMSTSLVELAGDLASFNNLAPTEVLEKLRAGLTGETEPLKTLGVNINQAAIEAKALEMGLTKDAKSLTAAQKATAVYSLILEQTTTAQGDFARTSGGLANQQRIMAAQFENVKSVIGTALLPVVTKVAEQMNAWLSDPAITAGLTNIANGIAAFATNVIAYLPTVISWFQGLIGWFMSNQGVIVGILAGLGAAVTAFVFTSVIPAVGAMISTFLPVLVVMALVGAAAYLLYQAWTTNFGGIRDTVMAFWTGTLQPALTQMQAWLAVNIPVALAWLANTWQTVLLPAMMAAWTWIQGNLFPVLASLWAWLQVNIPVAVAWLSNAWTTVLLPAIQTVGAWVTGTLIPTLAVIWNWLQTNIPMAIAWLSNAWTTVLLPAIQAVAGWVTGSLIPTLTTIWTWLSTNIPAALAWLAGVWTGTLLPAIQGVWGWLSGTLFPFLGALQELFATALTIAVTALAGVFQNVFLPAGMAVHDFFANLLSPAVQWLSDYTQNTFLPAWQGLTDFFNGPFASAAETVSGWVGDKLVKAFNWVTDAIGKVTAGINSLIEKLQNIKLPSWMTPGSPTPWQIGLEGVSKAMNDLSSSAVPKLESQLSFAAVSTAVNAPGRADSQDWGGDSGWQGQQGRPGNQWTVNQFVQGNDFDLAHAAWQLVDVINRNGGR